MGVRLRLGQAGEDPEEVQMGSGALRRGAECLPSESRQAPLLRRTEPSLRGPATETAVLPSHQEGRSRGGQQQQSRVGEDSAHHCQQQKERKRRANEDHR